MAAFDYLVFAYFIVLTLVYFVTSVLAFRRLRQYSYKLDAYPDSSLLASGFLPPITILAPAYGEEATCVESTQSLLALEYPEYEVIVINDGSKDRTFERMCEAFDMKAAYRMPNADIPTANVRGIYQSSRIPNLWLIDKENGGKADSLNTGINYTDSPLFCAVDADSLLEKPALTRIVRPYIENSDTVAVGGIIRIVNGSTVEAGKVVDIDMPKNIWAKFQVLEYFRAFLAGRMGWEAINATFIISGAFGLFHRATVVDAGGYATRRNGFETVGEDIELVIRLHRHCRDRGRPYRISYVPDPVAWTECPETLKVLHRQRSRWQRGLLEATTARDHFLGVLEREPENLEALVGLYDSYYALGERVAADAQLARAAAVSPGHIDVLSRQNPAEFSTTPRHMLTAGGARSTIDRAGFADWNDRFLEYRHLQADGDQQYLRAEHNHRFGMHDTLFEAGLALGQNGALPLELAVGFTPNDDFMAEYFARVGASRVLIEGSESFGTLVFNGGYQHSSYANGRTNRLSAGFEYYLPGVDMWFTPSVGMVRDQNGENTFAWTLGAHWQVAGATRIGVNYSDAPETENLLTVDTEAWGAYLQQDLTSRVRLFLGYNRIDRANAYVRQAVDLALQTRF